MSWVCARAAIQGAKRTSDLIPLCHPISLSSVNVEFSCLSKATQWNARRVPRRSGETGVEMEALTAVSVALLTIYDMCKAVDRGMRIEGVRLMEKRGGKSGHWQAGPDA